MSLQEIQTKIKGLLLNERLFFVALILAASGTAFGIGRISTALKQDRFLTKEGSTVAPANLLVGREHISASATLDGAGNSQKSVRGEVTPAVPKVHMQSQRADTENVLSLHNFVASRKGTKYHLPSCAGAQHISSANKIWFATKKEAEQSGYTKASNCKGL